MVRITFNKAEIEISIRLPEAVKMRIPIFCSSPFFGRKTYHSFLFKDAFKIEEIVFFKRTINKPVFVVDLISIHFRLFAKGVDITSLLSSKRVFPSFQGSPIIFENEYFHS